jgi:predicted pyridoxine 5'-phosphate oxidase superfamily flavin-nucleotide-binding protein
MSAASAFHAGERAVQERVGVDQQMAQIGPRVIRSYMPEQHRELLSRLPFILAGTVDAQGQPWASVLAGEVGFVESPDPRQLLIDARPLPHDPLNDTLVDGAPIGLLSIQPHTRRRNRVNGTVQLRPEGIGVVVGQSFGNCPKYIQAREPSFVHGTPAGRLAYEGTELDDAARRLITQADTYFIATAHPRALEGGDTRQGADVSHRGGRPGFVKVQGDTLTVPDFAGNNFFNTLGNIASNPRAGLLFMDFDNGDVLYVAVRASIVWDGSELDGFDGAQRLVKMDVTQVRRVEDGLPLRWGAAELSPYLPMGEWP